MIKIIAAAAIILKEAKLLRYLLMCKYALPNVNPKPK